MRLRKRNGKHSPHACAVINNNMRNCRQALVADERSSAGYLETYVGEVILRFSASLLHLRRQKAQHVTTLKTTNAVSPWSSRFFYSVHQQKRRMHWQGTLSIAPLRGTDLRRYPLPLRWGGWQVPSRGPPRCGISYNAYQPVAMGASTAGCVRRGLRTPFPRHSSVPAAKDDRYDTQCQTLPADYFKTTTSESLWSSAWIQ